MDFPGEQTFQKLSRLLVAPTLEPSQRAARIQAVEKDVILPLRVLLIGVLGYFFFLSHWSDVHGSVRDIGHRWFAEYFWLYVAVNVAAGVAFIGMRQMTLRTTQFIIFIVGLLDVNLMAGLVFMVDGFDSPFYWVFLVLILHNAVAIPLALPQLLLNFLATVGFVGGGMLDRTLIYLPDMRRALYAQLRDEPRTENPLERVIVLVIWAACCCFIQVLLEKQRRAEAQTTELRGGGSF